MTTARAAISWSAGKDSCLAWLLAREQGLNIRTFLTMCEPDGTSKSHALAPALIGAQVQAAGGIWRAARVPPGDYARVFDDELKRLVGEGHTHLVFGDIDLAAHRDWLEPACARVGLDAVFPLWGMARAEVAQAILARGIRARLVCVDTRWLDASFCGRDYDAALLARLPDGVCTCGEGGEFHTFVFDAPGFSHALPIVNGAQRVVRAPPPMSPVDLVMQALELVPR
jgi:uncharacterized protein (TIGR00290 family)